MDITSTYKRPLIDSFRGEIACLRAALACSQRRARQMVSRWLDLRLEIDGLKSEKARLERQVRELRALLVKAPKR
jgi:hypothetical protein